MKFTQTFVAAGALVASVSARPFLKRRDVDPALVPQFGLQSGLNPTGTGDCDGIRNAAGQVVKIPCFCPPDRGAFIQSLNANVAAGHVVNNPGVQVSFPTDSSKASQLARMQTAIVTLQNLRGPGVGCPAASTTFLAQQKAIQDFNAAPAPPPAAAAPPPPAPPAAPAPPAGGVDPALVPQFGLQSGLNPTGTGDCDGIRNAAGQVVKIPCACPPDRNAFIASLNANVAAGHVVNNPGVQVSFPTDSSKASQLARMQTAIVTLQNLRGPGVGCPAASTTFLAQQKAIQDFNAAPAAPPPAAAAPPPPPAPPAAPAPAAGGVNPALVPEFGLQSGLNPTGTGDCDGIRNAAGQIVKIPCACPPDRASFIASLSANVAAGKVVNNPGVAVSFPAGDSKDAKLARLQTAIVTLQNLRGPGVGCPAASTTFLAQQKAIQDGP